MSDEEDHTMMEEEEDDDEEEEDYEYKYSDDEQELSDAESEPGAADAHSSSKHGGGGVRAMNVPDNPNAAPLVTREETGGSVESDISALGGGGNPDAVHMLDSSELLPVMKRRLREVTDVLSIPDSAAVVLLREHKWAKERLFDAFLSNPERLQEKCGVRARCAAQQQQPTRTSSSSSSSSKGGIGGSSAASRTRSKTTSQSITTECTICCDDDIPRTDMHSMPCGHEFCLGCWNGFITCAVADGPTCVRTTCPQQSCGEAVTREEVAAVAPELLPKYEEYQLRSFVEMNGMTRWCPGPGCTRVAMASAAGFGGNAECDCGTIFCVRCGEEPHAPCMCSDLARWKEKCKNESETANWILANTKPCPKCSSRIEKNQGCNHMNCQQCKYEFCWICLGNWSEHGANTGGYYKCNKYDPATPADDQSDAAKAKRELDRYLHYYKRYHAHAVAQRFAEKQLKETEARMVLLQESTDNSTWSDVEFLKTATEQLVECRRVLKYTYTFAYYLTDSTKKKERFEHHQEMLERFTENLSELSEMPIAEMDRTDVVNQTRVVNRFMKNILTYVEDGMEE